MLNLSFVKKVAFILALLTAASCFSGCGKSDAAAAVDALIDEIGEVTLNSEAAILKAEEAAAALLEEDYAQLDGLEKLSEARTRYNELVLENEAAQVDALILAIGEVTLQSKSAIENAENAERKLSDGARPFLKNIQLLVDAREKYDELFIEHKAAEVDTLIDAIGMVSLESGNAIKTARDAYNGQTQAIKDRITGLAVLEAAEQEYQKLLEQKEIENADAVIDAIAAIGEVTLDSGEAIKYARDLYNALTYSEKKRVSNKNILEAAEKTFADLIKAERARQIEVLKKEFRISYDKITGSTIYIPNAMPKYVNTRSYVLPCIAEADNGLICMAIHYNYHGEDWIFWDNITILVDGVRYDRTFDYFDITRDVIFGDGVCEYSTEMLTANASMYNADIAMLNAIANSDETIIRFRGSGGSYDLTVSAEDKATIKLVLQLYELLLND